MARQRIFLPGFSHHVRHRGNNRCDVFKDDTDREYFLALLGKAAREHSVAVHGYVLMTTHYHALLTGAEPVSLPRTLQTVGRSYVRYFNDRHRRTGTLWEGRYRATLIGDERYWLTCLRYIELNPVAARMVAVPEAYRWSSYNAHARGVFDSLLTPHVSYLGLGVDAMSRSAVWAEVCGQLIPDAELPKFASPQGSVEPLARRQGSRRLGLRTRTWNRDSEPAL